MEENNKKNNTNKYWSIPKIEGFAGPDQLADVFISKRNWDRRNGRAEDFFAQSDESIRRLIALCYYVSQSQEEGVYPKFRIHVPRNSIRMPVTKFNPPVPINNVDDLRRLSPAASSFEYALSISVKNNNLFCAGLISTLFNYISFGFPEIGIESMPSGVFLRIDRPGEIRITEYAVTFLLRNGKVQGIIPFNAVTYIKDWLSELAEKFHNTIFKELPKEYINRFGGQQGLRGLIRTFLSKLLAEAINNRSGGAFIILPDSHSSFIKCKYPMKDFSLGAIIEKFWKACIDYTSCKEIETLKKLNMTWNKACLSG